jgi:phosphoribosylamine--glycine ligase
MAQNGEEKKKYKFLFVTEEALSVDLAWQLTKEGHDVKFFCQEQQEKDVGDGFVQKIDTWDKTWEAIKDWA